jgi:hypothetical protein
MRISSSPTSTAISPASRRTREISTPVRISMPSSSSAAVNSSVAVASERGEIRSACWTSTTRDPKRENIWANSSPTGPPPTTSRDSGSSVSSKAET